MGSFSGALELCKLGLRNQLNPAKVCPFLCLCFSCYFVLNYFSVSVYCYFYAQAVNIQSSLPRLWWRKGVIPEEWIPTTNTWWYLDNSFGCHFERFCLLLQSEKLSFCFMSCKALDRFSFKALPPQFCTHVYRVYLRNSLTCVYRESLKWRISGILFIKADASRYTKWWKTVYANDGNSGILGKLK